MYVVRPRSLTFRIYSIPSVRRSRSPTFVAHLDPSVASSTRSSTLSLSPSPPCVANLAPFSPRSHRLWGGFASIIVVGVGISGGAILFGYLIGYCIIQVPYRSGIFSGRGMYCSGTLYGTLRVRYHIVQVPYWVLYVWGTVSFGYLIWCCIVRVPVS